MSIFESRAFERSLFFPAPDASPPPPGASDRWIEAEGARLRIRVHGPERGRWMVCFVGIGETAGDFDWLAGRLGALAGGMAIAVAEYRGYGRSTGTPRYPALLEDARLVVRTLAGERPAAPLVLFGRSLGSQAVLHALEEAAPAAVVIDSGFASLDAFVMRRGLDPSEIAAEDRVRAYPGPLLAVHGAADHMIAPADGRAIAEASANPRSRFVAFEGKGHNDLFTAPAYFATLDAWLREVLPTR